MKRFLITTLSKSVVFCDSYAATYGILHHRLVMMYYVSGNGLKTWLTVIMTVAHQWNPSQCDSSTYEASDALSKNQVKAYPSKSRYKITTIVIHQKAKHYLVYIHRILYNNTNITLFAGSFILQRKS